MPVRRRGLKIEGALRDFRCCILSTSILLKDENVSYL